ncbi:MAG: acyl-CoA thioester hydrolase/BAAT C-terminal domain-containing protein [Sporomusa sp.]
MEYTYQKHGFVGRLFKTDKQQNNYIIFVLQGMAGLEYSSKFAELLCSKGIDALAISYYGVEGLPKKPSSIPLDQFKSATQQLEKQGYHYFGLYGTSRGAATALVVASIIPVFSCVIALSPVRFIYQGAKKNHSMYSYRGLELRYVPKRGLIKRFAKRILKEKKLRLCYMLEEWEKNAKMMHEIPVEKIKGSILILSSTIDESLPAKEHCERIIQRLEEYNFSYPYEHINYEEGSHNLGYCSNVNTWALPREKHYPRQCQMARENALKETLIFINKWKNNLGEN